MILGTVVCSTTGHTSYALYDYDNYDKTLSVLVWLYVNLLLP